MEGMDNSVRVVAATLFQQSCLDKQIDLGFAQQDLQRTQAFASPCAMPAHA
jgi:hypothetical protein